MKRWFVAVAILGLATVPAMGQKPAKEPPAKEALRAKLDPGLEPYQPSRPVSGMIRSVGEDYMGRLMDLWIDAFTKVHPRAQFTVEAKGTQTVIPALANGTADVGVANRNLVGEESAPFEQKYGYRPFAVRVGTGTYQHPHKLKPVAVIVNNTNPIDKLSLDQLDAIYSKTRKRGYKEDITTWGQLGLKGEWASRRITLHAVARNRGNAMFLRERVLLGGDFKDTIKEHASVKERGLKRALTVVAEAVAQDPGGIGYVGFGYAIDVKTVALAEKEGGPYYEGTFEEVASHRYPLTRFVYIVLNRAPGKPIDPKVKEFLRFVLSKEGQQALQKEGDILPLPAEIAKQERAKLD